MILVVEDDDGVRNLLVTLLKLSEYEPLPCAEAGEAERLLRANLERVGMAITDVQLGPGQDGVELAATLREMKPGMPILYLSGRDDHEGMNRDVAAGLGHFLMKPFTPKILAEKIASLLAVQSSAPVRTLRADP